MGCCTTSLTFEIPQEDRLFVQRELELGFSAHTCSRILQVFQKHQKQTDSISIAEFNALARDLKLEVHELDLRGSAVNRLYTQMSQQGVYDPVKLRTLAVLLSKGKDKADAYFSCISSTGIATATQVRSLFSTLTLISGQLLPLLAASSYEDSVDDRTYNPDFVQTYIRRLELGQETAVERWTNLVLCGNSEVTGHHFCHIFQSQEELRALHSPFQVRLALSKFAAERSRPLPRHR